MKIEYDKSFYRDIKKIKDKQLSSKLKNVIKELKSIKNINELRNVKKMRGTDYLYRLKVNNYRLGFELNENTVILLKFLHRKDIYKYFP